MHIASGPDQTDGTGRQSSWARMASADLVQTNGLGLASVLEISVDGGPQVQQTFDPALGKALLPAPHGRPAVADALGHPLRRVPIRRSQHAARPLDMLARPVAVGRNRRQLLILRDAQNHTY